jgi:bifunctional non-homologous end joining protein LigD
MLAGSADIPFDDEDWLFEIKWDGIRAMAYVDSDVILISRNSRDITGQFPELGELPGLAPGTVLDGEIVVMTGGKPDIQALLPRVQAGTGMAPAGSGNPPVTFIIFDILEADGKPLINLPLIERKKILQGRVKEGGHVVISVPVDSQGVDYYKAAIQLGLEGVVAKRKSSVYEPGVRSANWLKIKHEKSCDCVVAGYTHGNGGRSASFGALVLGLYRSPGWDTRAGTPGRTGERDREGLVYIGKVGTGFSDRDLSSLMEAFAGLKTDVPQVFGIAPSEEVAWLVPGIVCEVEYQSLTKDRKLRIPRFIRVRPDKSPWECTTSQLETGVSGTPDGNDMGEVPGDKGHRTIDRGSGPSGTALTEYREKRDFSKTNEPAGHDSMQGRGDYFVVHEHHARNLHFDLRLEREGVLKSWAVPKGVPLAPGEKHLAIQVEDHPLEYGHFEGDIPQGEYGAGTVSIWDNGTYDTKHWDDEKIEVFFRGKRLNGPYVLVKFKRAGRNEWLLFRAGT